MALNIIALIGQVTKAETSLLTGEDYSDWRLRKDDPSTPSSSLAGLEDRKRENFVLVCASLSELERAALLLAFEGRARRLSVLVKETSRPDLILLPSLIGVDISFQTVKSGFYITARSDGFSIDIGRFTSSLIRPVKRIHSPDRVLVEDSVLGGLVQASRHASFGVGSIPKMPDSILPFDCLITDIDSENRHRVEIEKVLGQHSIPAIDGSNAFAVDTRWINPTGLETEPTRGSCSVILDKIKHRNIASVVNLEGENRTFDVSRHVDENLKSLLGSYRVVDLQRNSGVCDKDLIFVAGQLLCAGIPTRLDFRVSAKVPKVQSDIVAICETLKGVDLSDDLQRQKWSVVARRWALRTLSQESFWSENALEHGLRAPTYKDVTVLIPSRRPAYIASAVRQALAQANANIEIIVGLHGFSVDEVLRSNPWLASEPSVRLVSFDSRMLLGEILNGLSEKADGNLIAKMDDDDLYSRHHIEDLVAALEYSGAELVGCKAEFIYLEGSNTTIQRRPNSEKYGASVTGGTIMLPRQVLRDVAGWSGVGTAEDRLLQANVKLIGGRVYRTHGLNYVMRRGDGMRAHTWKPSHDFFARDAVISWSGTGYPGWVGCLDG